VNHPIAIVGASARAAAASAVRAGFRPIVADLFADADLRSIATTTRVSPYPDGLLDWLRTVEPPAWMYTGAMENHPELVDQMAWVAPLWGNAGDVLANVRDPEKLAAAIGNAGLWFPETRGSSDGLPRDGSWLVKTYRGASGSGVRPFEETGRQGDKETRRSLGEDSSSESPCLPLSLSPGVVYQKRIEGTPCAAVFAAADGAAALLGITRQLVGEDWLGGHGFQYGGSIGPHPISDAGRDSIARVGDVLVEQFELTGLFGVDFIWDGERAWTLEVNPRYTASVEIVERATGVHAIAVHAAACRDSTIHIPGEPPGMSRRDKPAGSPSFETTSSPLRAHGKAILFADRELVISNNFAAMAFSEASRQPWPMLADVPSAGTIVESGRPVLTVFADGATIEDVQAKLQKRVADLKRELYAGNG